MTQDSTQQISTSDKVQDDTQTALQTTGNETGQELEISQIHWAEWPNSKPGPRTTPAPAGTKAINSIRREQVTPYIYNQETGETIQLQEPKTTGEQMLGKRKQRL